MRLTAYTLLLMFGAWTAPAYSAAIEIRTDDDFALQGTLTTRSGAREPGVVLLHQCGGSRTDWERLSELLHRKGFSVLSVDLRGYGDSVSAEWDVAQIRELAVSREDYFERLSRISKHWPADVDNIINYFRTIPEVADDNVSVVSASCSSGQVLGALYRKAKLRALAFVSPSLRERTMHNEWWGALERAAAPPLYILASKNDEPTFTESLRAFGLTNHEDSVMTVVSGHAHASELLQQDPQFEKDIVRWLADMQKPDVANRE